MHNITLGGTIVIVASIASFISTITAVYNSLVYTKLKPRISVLKGLIPLFLFCKIFVLLFTFTEWAWNNAGYVTLMVFPIVSLLNSRQIVCNVAN